MKRITADMTFDELLKTYPKSRAVLKEYGLTCMDCKGRKADTLAIGALNNGIDINEFLKALQSSLTKSSRTQESKPRARSR